MKGKFRDPNKTEQLLFAVTGAILTGFLGQRRVLCATRFRLRAPRARRSLCLRQERVPFTRKAARQADLHCCFSRPGPRQHRLRACVSEMTHETTGSQNWHLLKMPASSSLCGGAGHFSFYLSNLDAYGCGQVGGTWMALSQDFRTTVLPVELAPGCLPRVPLCGASRPVQKASSSQPGAEGTLPLGGKRGRPSGWA